MNENFEPYSAF